MMRYKITYEVDTTMNLPTLAKFLYTKQPIMDRLKSIEYIGESPNE